KRYATGADLADDLGRFLRAEPIRARPVGMAERAWRWYRRNRLAARLVMAVAIILMVATGVSLWFAVEARHQAKLAKLKAIELRFNDSVQQPEQNRAFSRLTTAKLLCYAI